MFGHDDFYIAPSASRRVVRTVTQAVEERLEFMTEKKRVMNFFRGKYYVSEGNHNYPKKETKKLAIIAAIRESKGER